MLHVPAASFSAAQAEPAPALPPLKPAEYLRLRREAAGLSIEQVAALCSSVARQADAEALVRLLETPGWKARYGLTLRRLRRAYRFDLDVYRQLGSEPADRHPRVCRSCGGSHWDRHPDDRYGITAWPSAALCSGCDTSEDR